MSNSPSESSVQKEYKVLKLDQILEPSEPLRKKLKLDEEGFQDSVSNNQFEPIIVRPLGDKFEIINGHRRYAALKAANKTEADCIIRRGLSEEQVDLMRLAENFDRIGLDPMEIADGLEKALIKYHYTQKELAQKLYKTDKWISDHLIVRHDASLSVPVRARNFSLSAGVEIKHAEKQLYKFQKEALINKAAEKHYSSKQVREKAQEMIRKNNETRSRKSPCFFCGKTVHRDPKDPYGKRLLNGHYFTAHDSCAEQHTHGPTLDSP